MIKLNVWLTLLHDSPVHVGELIAAPHNPQKGGSIHGQFRYTQAYLDWGGAIPLDPIHFPLGQKIYNADRPRAGIHGVFEDSLPDDWGRKILIRKHGIAGKEQRLPQLLRFIGGDGMGALSYGDDDIPPERRAVPGVYHLNELRRQAALFEKDPATVDQEVALLFEAGSSPGGARPKALIQKNSTGCLAKFSSVKDIFDVVGLEAAAMELARRAGVDAAASECVYCGSKKVLLFDRFDIDEEKKTRSHIISMQTLLAAGDYYYLAYRDMADIIRSVSSAPAEDLIKLFKQLVFNVCIGNTDDHLKNFSMVCDGSTWRLSPAYDLVPDIGQNREHVLSINASTQVPNHAALMREARYFGIKEEGRVRELIDTVTSAVQGWKQVFRQFDVPSSDIATIGSDITARLGSLLLRSKGR